MVYLLVSVVVVLLIGGAALFVAHRHAQPAHSTGGRVATDEIDDELRGVFIAEVKAEIGNLRRNLMLWKVAPANSARVMPLRRSFHTLKGSSRMVGVPTLGDFNAKFERLLDRVIDKSLVPDAAVVAVVEQAVAALPELLAQFETARAPRLDIATIMKTADRLVKAERAAVRPLHPRASGDERSGAGGAGAASASNPYSHPDYDLAPDSDSADH